MSKQTLAIIIAAVLIIGGIGGFMGYRLRPLDLRALPAFNEAPAIREVVKIKRVAVPGPKEVQVIEKERIIEKLPIPQAVKDDPAQQIIATGEITPDRNRGNVEAVATLNTTTGQATMFIRQEDRKFLEIPNEKEIGIGYGIDSHGHQGATVYGRWDVLRVGSVVVHAYGEIGSEGNNSADARVQLRAGYRF